MQRFVGQRFLRPWTDIGYPIPGRACVRSNRTKPRQGKGAFGGEPRDTKLMLLLTHSDQVIRSKLETELSVVESRLAAELISELPCVNELVSHVERYRGKMLRPTMVLVAGLAGSPNGQELTEAHRVVAAVTEMVHLATLVHDDVLDEAKIRRGGPTINHLKGNEAAVMLGDYLISHAYHLCSSLDGTTTSRIIADSTNVVCEGELLQLANRGNHQLDERTYFEIIRRKTASLCGTCCRLGVLLWNGRADLAEDLYGYGENLGIAYQIIDDLLDLVGAEHTVGKTLGLDLTKGKMTLPVIHFLRVAPAQGRREMLDLLDRLGRHDPGAGGLGANHHLTAAIRERITTTGSMEYAQKWASRLIQQAKDSLSGLIESPSKAVLVEMADAVLTRKF